MSSSRENPPLTELQIEELKKLDQKQDRTEKQSIRLAELVQKRENSKDVVLSDTCISYLVEAYSWEVYGKFNVTKEMDIEYIQKGRRCEEEAIELLSFVKNKLYHKNEERLENGFLSGLLDVFAGVEIKKAESITDIKVNWSLPGFLYKIHKGVDDGYREQVAGYGILGDCTDLSVTYALVDTPEDIRNGYKFRLADKMGAFSHESPSFLREWAKIEGSMKFAGDIPATSRIYQIPIEPFTDKERADIYERVKNCREWLFNFDNLYKKLNQ